MKGKNLKIRTFTTNYFYFSLKLFLLYEQIKVSVPKGTWNTAKQGPQKQEKTVFRKIWTVPNQK